MNARASSISSLSTEQHLILTVHGIRTFGQWQHHLEEFINREDTENEIDVHMID